MTTLDVSLPSKASLREPRVNLEREALRARSRRMRWAGRVSLAIPLLGAAAGAWLSLGGARRRSAALGVIGASFGLGLVRWQLQRLVTETLPYELQATLDDIELRAYPAQIWAETLVQQAAWNDTLEQGFRRLAGYISGHNAAARRHSMIVPARGTVAREEAAHGEKISMTAPVLATLRDGPGSADRSVAFVMPKDRGLLDLPTPDDPRVRLRAVPERLVAALAFRGNYKDGLPHDKCEQMLVRLHAAGIKTRGEPMFAGYDPPTTLPMLRRNEVLVELADV